MPMNYYDYMAEAIQIAKVGADMGEVPVGAVIVHNNRIIAKEHNRIEALRDATAHAELIAIKSTVKELGEKYLNECEIYVTLEPCSMCAGAMILTKIKKLIYGATYYKAGACGSLYMIASDKRLNHRIEVIQGIMEEECTELIKNYFRQLRQNR